MLAAAAAALGRAPVRAQVRPSVRFGSALDDTATPVLYGQQSGLFTRLGFDSPDIQVFSSGATITTAVAAGAIDVGKTSLLGLLNAHLRGVSFTIVAGGSLFVSERPSTGLIVAKDAPIRTGAELNGQTISVPALKSLPQISVQAWVDQHGGDSSTLKFVEVPNVAARAALEQGRVVAAALDNPVLAEALESGKGRLLARDMESIAKRFLIAAWFCTTEYRQRNPDLVRRIGDGIRQASVYANGHQSETVAMSAAFTKVDPELVRKMNRTILATSLDVKEIQPVVDAAAKYKVIERAFPASELL